MKRYIKSSKICSSKVIDFAEPDVTEFDVSRSDWRNLQTEVNFYRYNSLRQMAEDLINIIQDDEVFTTVEWNLFHKWFDEIGFTEDDWDYVLSCGYERDQFDPDRFDY